MAKRLSDTDKWKKPFIRSLETPYKLLWFYILDDCDHAGIWHVDMEVACLRIGENLTINEAIMQFSDKISVIDNGTKWFIRDFIEFQYGELNHKNRVHESVLRILSKYNLLQEIKPLTSPLQGVKDKDKDKDKDNDIIYENSEKIKSGIHFVIGSEFIPMSPIEYVLKEKNIYLESALMQAGQNMITVDEFISDFSTQYFTGSIFKDHQHFHNCIKSTITRIREKKKLISQPHKFVR